MVLPTLESPRDLARIRERLDALVERCEGRPLAVVAGTSINALGVVRSLGGAGIPAVWLTSNPYSFVNRSRFASCVIACRDVIYEGLLPALMTLGRACTVRPVLFLTNDFQVKQVSDARDELGHYYSFALPEKPLVDAMLSKTGFWNLAEQHGLGVPETHILKGTAELEDFMERRGSEGRWVVKPPEKNDAFEARFSKALTVTGLPAWQRFAHTYRGLNVELLIQAWIPGRDTSVRFCLVVFDRAGECLLAFSGRKIRQYLPEVGNTASAERYVDPDTEAETVRFFRECKFVGMGSVEFKRSETSDVLYAIEPTVGRTNLQSEVATVNGFNLAALYYHSLVGDAKEIDVYREKARVSTQDRVWIRGGADLKASWHYRKRDQLSFGQWVRPYLRPLSCAVWRISDPLPYLVWAQRKGMGLLRDAGKGVLLRVRGRRPSRRG